MLKLAIGKAKRNLNTKAKNYFQGIVKESFREFVNDQITQRFESAISENSTNNGKSESSNQESMDENAECKEEEVAPENLITEEELEGFRIVRAILRQCIGHKRVIYKSYKTFFNILLDGSTRKPLCRFYFNTRNKYIELFDHGKDASEKVYLEELDNIYDYADRIRATLNIYT